MGLIKEVETGHNGGTMVHASSMTPHSYTGKTFYGLNSLGLFGKNMHCYIQHERGSAFHHEKFISTKLCFGHIMIWPRFAASGSQTSTQQRCSGLRAKHQMYRSTFSSYRQQEPYKLTVTFYRAYHIHTQKQMLFYIFFIYKIFASFFQFCSFSLGQRSAFVIWISNTFLLLLL